MSWFRGEDTPAQAISEPEKAEIVKPNGDKNSSAVKTVESKPPADNAGKTEKDAVTQGAASCVTDDVQAPPDSTDTVGRPPESRSSSAEATFSYNGETITEDTMWSGRVIVRGSVTIAPQATVTVSAGTVVEFSRSAGRENTAVLLVRGRIAANGTKDWPVKFLPKGDEARSATWQGIVFLASEKNNILEHCRVEAAETGVDADYSTITVKDSFFSGCRTALRVRDCRVRISGCTASNCDLGAGLNDSEAEIAGGTLVSNRAGVLAKRSSLYLADTIMADNNQEGLRAEESNIKIVGNKFGGNGDGLVLSSCEGLVSGNRIAQNGDCGISLTGSRVRVTANDISQNGRIGIRVTDGKGIAWGNIISANGRYDLYNAGREDFRAIGNWWGEGSAPDSPGKIYDKAADPGSGKVFCFPVLRDKPGVLP
jgi:parallel beta-helix repeat protein